MHQNKHNMNNPYELKNLYLNHLEKKIKQKHYDSYFCWGGFFHVKPPRTPRLHERRRIQRPSKEGVKGGKGDSNPYCWWKNPFQMVNFLASVDSYVNVGDIFVDFDVWFLLWSPPLKHNKVLVNPPSLTLNETTENKIQLFQKAWKFNSTFSNCNSQRKWRKCFAAALNAQNPKGIHVSQMVREIRWIPLSFGTSQCTGETPSPKVCSFVCFLHDLLASWTMMNLAVP